MQMLRFNWLSKVITIIPMSWNSLPGGQKKHMPEDL